MRQLTAFRPRSARNCVPVRHIVSPWVNHNHGEASKSGVTRHKAAADVKPSAFALTPKERASYIAALDGSRRRVAE
jgi:hypothetical protein